MSSTSSDPRVPRTRRMPKDSFFYNRLVPVLFLVLALVTLTLITIAAGVLLGFIHYR